MDAQSTVDPLLQAAGVKAGVTWDLHKEKKELTVVLSARAESERPQLWLRRAKQEVEGTLLSRGSEALTQRGSNGLGRRDLVKRH